MNEEFFCPSCEKDRHIMCDDDEMAQSKYCIICRRKLISKKPKTKKEIKNKSKKLEIIKIIEDIQNNPKAMEQAKKLIENLDNEDVKYDDDDDILEIDE